MTNVFNLSKTCRSLLALWAFSFLFTSHASANLAPVVNRLSNQLIEFRSLPAVASLSAKVTDDGLPNPPGTTTYSWKKVSGMGSVSFSSPTTKETAVYFNAPGYYILKFTAYDGSLATIRKVHLTVTPAPVLAFNFDNVTSSSISENSKSGNNYTSVATSLNGPFIPTTGPSFSGSGKAIYFDGTQGQRIEVAGTALTVPGFTIMADVNLTNPMRFTDPQKQRYEISEKAGSYWANIRLDQGAIRPGPPYVLRVGGFFNGGIFDSDFAGSKGITPGTWQNVAFVFDQINHLLITYVDGVLDHSAPRDGSLDTSVAINGLDEKLVIGAKHREGKDGEVLGAYFDGKMDNYRLYNSALTAEMIRAIAGVPVAP